MQRVTPKVERLVKEFLETCEKEGMTLEEMRGMECRFHFAIVDTEEKELAGKPFYKTVSPQSN